MRTLLGIACFAVVILGLPATASAQQNGTSLSDASSAGAVSGIVDDANGTPVKAARVAVEGGRALDGVLTTSDGHFVLTGIKPGTYTVIVTRSGFETAHQSGIVIVDSAPVEIRVTLAQSSFSSLRTIGRSSTNGGGRSQINTTPSSVALISNQTFTDQGRVQLVDVVNETPGIITTHTQQNGASQGTQQVTMIRGGLAYETESLIDGHPISIGATGVYNPILINPGLLQDVEVVKGPGSFATEINSAINGTVNYRTLEPTKAPRESFQIASDQYGGVATGFRATGSIPNHFVDYAFALSTNGTNGPLFNYPLPSSTVNFYALGNPPYTIGGQQIATNNLLNNAPTTAPQYAGYIGQVRFTQPLYFYSNPISTYFHQDGELGKLRLNLSQQTALTLSYLGGQAVYDSNVTTLGAFEGNGVYTQTFVPPAGYTGSVPSGTHVLFDNNAGFRQTTSSQTNLFQAELRSAIGPITLLGRYYSGFEQDDTSSPGAATATVRAWGGIPVCPVGDTATAAGGCALPSGAPGPAPTTPIYDGQLTTIGAASDLVYSQINTDHFRGFSFELAKPFGDNSIALSFDRANHDSTEFLDSSQLVTNGYQLSPGSGQQYTTILGRAQVALAPRVSAFLGDYLIKYDSHYSGDGGITWGDSSHSFNAPRLAILARPNTDTSLRFSLGASIAPPYISLLSAPGGPPVPNISGEPTYYTQNVNNGQLAPETAFGYDLGIDQRIARRTTITADVYLTNLRDAYLNQTYQNGTYTATGGVAAGHTAPLYITQTANLGNARYEGIEAALVHDPVIGFGYRIQGSLLRAFPYSVPNSLYVTSSGPYTTNLAVIPNVNFQPSSRGYNSVEDPNAGEGRVPYAQGYAEVNYATRHGLYANLGVTYYGNNNSYNNPPFGVVSGSLRYALSPRSSIQLSGFNLTQAYAQPYYFVWGGIPVPLVNGTHGATSGNLGTIESGNVGPATYRLILSTAIGR